MPQGLMLDTWCVRAQLNVVYLFVIDHEQRAKRQAHAAREEKRHLAVRHTEQSEIY